MHSTPRGLHACAWAMPWLHNHRNHDALLNRIRAQWRLPTGRWRPVLQFPPCRTYSAHLLYSRRLKLPYSASYWGSMAWSKLVTLRGQRLKHNIRYHQSHPLHMRYCEIVRRDF